MSLFRRWFPLLVADTADGNSGTTNSRDTSAALSRAIAERDDARHEVRRLTRELEEAKAAIRVHERENRLLWLLTERDMARVGSELANHERAKALALADVALGQAATDGGD